MNEDYPPDFVAVTAGDVLAVIRDQHRQQCAWDAEADSEIDLQAHSSIDDWRMACDLLGWRRLATALNEYWSVEIGLDEWRAVLEPAQEKTLGGVCTLLAGHARLREFDPFGLLEGIACRVVCF